MKHLFTKLSAAACALLAGTALVSCDSSDSAGMETFFERMEVNFVYALSQDLHELTDVKLTYTDPAGDGTPQTETLTESVWSKKFQVKKFPATFTVTVAATLKENADLSKASYTLTREITTEFLEYRNDGKIYWFQGPDVDRTASIVEIDENNPNAVKEGIDTAVASLNQTYTYTVTKKSDGNYEVVSSDR